MIIGSGIDIVEMKRIESVFQKQDKFMKRVLTEKEQSLFNKLTKRRKIEFLAGRFAAKEAFAKAIGTGIGKHLSWQDIEIIPNERGKPLLQSRIISEPIHLSISHSKEFAVAHVIIEKSSC